MNTVQAERPNISNLTLEKWLTRGVPHWARASVLERARRENVEIAADAFKPRPRRAPSRETSAA
jgi:hypothetical protein